MRATTETLFRYLALLQQLPQQPDSISTPQIRARLQRINTEYSVHLRTIQRDLEKLSGHFPISNEERGRTNHWYWTDKSALTQIPAMSGHTALAFRLGREYLSDLMPPATLELLEPYFRHAAEVLDKSELSRWKKKVRIIQRGPALLAPKVEPSVQQVVYRALLEGKQVKAVYRPRGGKEDKEYIMHPQGLVVREGVIYLLASLWSYPDILHFPLQRMRRAELLDERANELAGFDLDRHIHEEKEFSYPIGNKTIRLKIRLGGYLATHLAECRLANDQKISTRRDGSTVLEATVADTRDLRWWLLGFGDNIEVLAPKALRREFSELFSGLAGTYGAEV